MALETTGKWKFVITATDGTIPAGAGEIIWASQKTFSDNLNGMRSASVAVNVDHPILPWLLNNFALLKVYRQGRDGNWSLRMVGDVLSTEEKGSGDAIGQVTITSADPFWRLSKRLIGTGVNGTTYDGTGFTIGSGAAPVDLTTVQFFILQQVITGPTGFPVGIGYGSFVLSGTASAVGPLYTVFAGQTMQEVSAVLGGPDFWIQPQEPSGGSMPNTQIGVFNSQAIRGTIRPNAIFEYGMGKHNVDNYDRLRTRQNQANTAWALPQGWPTAVAHGDILAVSADATSENNEGRFEDIVSTDVGAYVLRKILCDEAVQIRKDYQQQITFQPSANNPVDYVVDYDVGDIVTARAFDMQSNTFRYNGSVRVYGIAATIDENDSEIMSLTLIPQQNG